MTLTKEQMAEVIGRAIARAVFDGRSRKSNGYRNVEVHLSEQQLAGVIAEGAPLEMLRRKREVEA